MSNAPTDETPPRKSTTSELPGTAQQTPASTQSRPTIKALVRSHYALMYRYAYRLISNVNDAEDLVQQCFLAAQEKLHQLRDPQAARAWLFQILRSRYARLCRRKRPTVASDADLEMQGVPAETVDSGAIDPELLQLRLNELKEEYRIALLMYYFEEKSYDEISQELDIPIGTVMSRLSRAKSQLRGRIRSKEVLQ